MVYFLHWNVSSMRAGAMVCLLFCWVPSAKNSALHRVGAQYIFVE